MKYIKIAAFILLLCSIVFALQQSYFNSDIFGYSKYKNVVLVTIDTQRADFISSYGSEIANTPTLDGIAKKGARFEMCISAAFGTVPSHSSIMTSRYARTHGVYDNKTPLGDESVTLAEVLKQKGYSTAAFVSALPVHREVHLDQGFDYYDQNYIPPPNMPYERPAGDTTDAVLRWLNAGGFKNPSFLWVHYFDPHWTYNPPLDVLNEKIDFQAEVKKSGILIDSSEILKYKNDGYHIMKMSYGIFAFTLEDFMRIHKILYAAETENVDRNIKRIMKWFDEKGLTKNTIFIFVGDHGETIDDENHEAPFTHMTVYQEVAHVPLIVMAPGDFKGGRVVDTPVSTIDIFPTVMKFLGIDTATTGVSPEGFPLQDVMKGKHEQRPIFLETAHRRGAGVLLGNMKYLDFVTPEAYFTYSGKAVGEQLFNLETDPDELDNLIGKGDPSEAELRDVLKSWKESAPSVLEKDSDSKTIKDKKYLDKLKDLGYM